MRMNKIQITIVHSELFLLAGGPSVITAHPTCAVCSPTKTLLEQDFANPPVYSCGESTLSFTPFHLRALLGF